MIGLGKLPLDGNPFRYTGIIAHPGPVNNLVTSSNGQHILTSSSTQHVVNVWTYNSNVLEQQILEGGEGMEPFLHMLDPYNPTRESPIYKEFQDYFYYSQLKMQGEDVSVQKITKDTVTLDQIPEMIQAMGYYPSQQEIDDVINEVKFAKFATGTTVDIDAISLDEIVQLYLNHRPVCPPTREDLEIALSYAKRLEPGKPLPIGPAPKLEANQIIKIEGLNSLLSQFGIF
jgi:WD40 repeat protein